MNGYDQSYKKPVSSYEPEVYLDKSIIRTMTRNPLNAGMILLSLFCTGVVGYVIIALLSVRDGFINSPDISREFINAGIRNYAAILSGFFSVIMVLLCYFAAILFLPALGGIVMYFSSAREKPHRVCARAMIIFKIEAILTMIGWIAFFGVMLFFFGILLIAQRAADDTREKAVVNVYLLYYVPGILAGIAGVFWSVSLFRLCSSVKSVLYGGTIEIKKAMKLRQWSLIIFIYLLAVNIVSIVRYMQNLEKTKADLTVSSIVSMVFVAAVILGFLVTALYAAHYANYMGSKKNHFPFVETRNAAPNTSYNPNVSYSGGAGLADAPGRFSQMPQQNDLNNPFPPVQSPYNRGSFSQMPQQNDLNNPFPLVQPTFRGDAVPPENDPNSPFYNPYAKKH